MTALHEDEWNIDARLDLVSLLLEEDKKDEAISVLSPPDSGLGDIVLGNYLYKIGQFIFISFFISHFRNQELDKPLIGENSGGLIQK